MKQTVKQQVMQAVDGKTLSVKEITKIVKKPIGQVYTVLSLLLKEKKIVKKGRGIYRDAKDQATSDLLSGVNKSEVAYKASKGKKAKRKYTKRQADRHEYVNGAQVLISNDINKLQAEVFKLNDWCLQWSSKVKETEAKYAEEVSRLKYMVCDKDAVISYLEDKLVQVFAKAQ